MERLRRFLPDALAGRIILLLVSAIVFANLIGLVILTLEQQRFDRNASIEREIERTAALVPAMETVDAPTRRLIADDASTRFARVRVQNKPMLQESVPDRRSSAFAQQLSDALGRDDVRVSIIDRQQPDANDNFRSRFRAEEVIAITIPLTQRDGRPEWLNVVTRGVKPPPERIDGQLFLTVLILSLLLVLGVSMLIARHLTKPLAELSNAAKAVGRGDRSIRVPEEGPREMRDAARAFNVMQDEIARFDAERVRMLAAVGHDLRTPMTSLRIRAEMVDEDEQRDAMVRILDEMTVMADGLVSYAQKGEDTEPFGRIDLGSLVRQLCEDRGVKCTAPEGIEVKARRVGLGRAVGNLIDNAIRYGGSASVSLTRDDTSAFVAIDDEGPGIPTESLESVFQPFVRGDNSRSLSTGGTGLGLSIARTIIVAHRGQVTLENREQGGLRATATIPLGPPK